MRHLYLCVKGGTLNADEPERHRAGVDDSEADGDVGDELIKELHHQPATRGEAATLVNIVLRAYLWGKER